MSGLALKISGYTAPAELNLPKLYKDAVIDTGSVYAYDSSTPESWESQDNAVIGSELLNLVDGGANGVFTANTPFLTGSGFQFTVTGGQRIKLPEAAKLTGYDGCFAAGVWIKVGTQTQTNNSVFGWYNAAGGGYGLRHTTGGSHQAICGDKFASVPAPASGIRQVVIARVKDASGNYFAAFYRNGVRIGLQAMTATMVQPSTPPADAALGDVASTGDAGTWIGSIGRSWFTRKDFTVEEMDAKVLKDYNMNKDFYI